MVPDEPMKATRRTYTARHNGCLTAVINGQTFPRMTTAAFEEWVEHTRSNGHTVNVK